jgi:menaquinone-9 beta-reductase
MPSASSHLDLAIIGAGPAGTAAAITAARSGARVALFEAKAFPRHKVCGEFVSAEALDVLTELLGSQERIDLLLSNAPTMTRTRLFMRNRMVEANVFPPGLSITRFHLDATLWDTAKYAGVICRDGCDVSSVEGNGPFRLQTAAGESFARSVIIAAGRWSQFAADRTLPPGPKWIGLKAYFDESDPSLTTDLYFFQHGYCGVQRVTQVSAQPMVANPSTRSGQALGHRPEAVVNACAMVRSDRASTLPEVFALHPALHDRAARWKQVIPAVSTAPLVYRRPQAVRSKLAFVGDAAAFIDPFVGDGISIALRSGKLAAECLGRFLMRDCSLEQALIAYHEEYDQRFAPLLSVASRVRRALSLPALPRALAFELLRIPGVMPLLIRKTRQAA